MPASRRNFLKGLGALVVSFSSGPLMPAQQGDLNTGTHTSHIDPAELDSWLAIDADGAVTAYTGKCDLGQGIFTAQSQLVAEELCLPLARVTLLECDTAVTPDQGSTSGSQSTPINFNQENLALAAATAREALVGMAARHFGQPANELTVSQGMVRSSSGQQISYAELIGSRRFDLRLNKASKRRTPAEWTVLGKPIPSLDRPALMTGTFEYVHYVHLPGMLHARVVRPPSMGAHLLSVDRESVRAIPGMVQVVVRQNFVGVVAETQHAATVAARELATEWEPGPALPAQDGFHHFLQNQPARDQLSVDSGDLGPRLADAAHRLTARYTYPFQMHGSVGSSCAVADVHPGTATVWSATQSAYPTRDIVALLLDLPKEQVRVIYRRGSGCYGLNGADAVSFDAAMLSQAVGRPVRLQYSRQDEMMWENLGSATVVEHRAGLSGAGRIVAWDREDWVAERGGRPGYDQPGNVISGMLVGYDPEPITPAAAKPPTGRLRNSGNAVPPYLAGCIDGQCSGGGTVHSERVLTHTVMAPFFSGPLRAPLRIQNTFATECFLDELAQLAGVDPVAYRIEHLTDVRLIAVIRAAAERAAWQPRPKLHAHASDGIVRGRGFACVAYEGQNGYAAMVAEIEVDLRTGAVQPRRYVVAIDCGPVSNPDGLRNQIEGGTLQGTSRALVEEVTWDHERITSVDWITYGSLRLDLDPPMIESVFVSPPGVRATGAGETAICVTPAALGNAIFDATGVRLRDIPFTPQRILTGLAASRPVSPGGAA